MQTNQNIQLNTIIVFLKPYQNTTKTLRLLIDKKAIL